MGPGERWGKEGGKRLLLLHLIHYTLQGRKLGDNSRAREAFFFSIISILFHNLVCNKLIFHSNLFPLLQPDHVVQWVGHLTQKSEVLGSISGLATYFRFANSRRAVVSYWTKHWLTA